MLKGVHHLSSGGLSGFVEALSDRVALGIVVGLVVGKAVGIFGSTYLMARFTRASLDTHLKWIDVLGLSVLAGIGFTVSLLIGELAFGSGSTRDEHVKVGVLTGSVLAALIAAVILRTRNRAYRQACEEEEADPPPPPPGVGGGAPPPPPRRHPGRLPARLTPVSPRVVSRWSRRRRGAREPGHPTCGPPAATRRRRRR